MQPLISIIVPVYNVAPYILRFIESLSEACANISHAIEIIIVNDGSTDESMTILSDFLDTDSVLKPNTIIINKPNGGVSSARNKGIEHATGVWLLPLDPDDFIAPDYIAKFEKAASEANNDISIIAGGITLWWSDECQTVKPIKTNSEYEASIISMSMFNVTKLFRRSVIEHNKLKYDTLFTSGEDAQFLFEYWGAATGRIMPIDNNGYYYRQRHSSLSKTHLIEYQYKLQTYRLFRQAIKNCVNCNQLSSSVWQHWRKMLGFDLYDMIADLRKSPEKHLKTSEILARDFSSEEIDDLKYFECSKIRSVLNRVLIFSVKRRLKRK